MSTDATLDDTDLEVGTVTDPRTLYTVNVPANLVPSTATAPVRYYFGLIPRSNTTTTPLSLYIFPANSLFASSFFPNSFPDVRTLNATNTQAFIQYTIASTVTKFTASAYQLTGGLDVSIALIRKSDLSIISNLTTNANGANNFEFASYTATGGSSVSVYLRVSSVGGTTGTFKANMMGNISFPSSTGVSCAGGATTLANRCITFPTDHINRPTNSAGCVTLFGIGSVYSGTSCTVTNLVSQCFANPFSNNGYAVYSFYNANDTTTTAETACGGDIIKLP